jgi:hypothetical protein
LHNCPENRHISSLCLSARGARETFLLKVKKATLLEVNSLGTFPLPLL